MQLMSSRWFGVWISAPMGLIMAWRLPFSAVWIAILVLLALPVLAYFFLPSRVVAELNGKTLRIGGRSAAIADLLHVRTKTGRVYFLPLRRTMIFTFRPGETAGPRKLRLPLRNVAGGLKAAEAFAAQALAVANGRAALTEALHEADRQDGFDPDAIIARYLAERDSRSVPVAPARRFGRKGLIS